MDNLSLNPSTQKQLENYLKAPSHGLLLVGPKGIGKLSLAVALAEKLLGVNDFYAYPQAKVITRLEDKKLISIDAVRELDNFLSLKVVGTKTINRIVIVQDAHELSLDAQNALLKMLEEPPKGSVIILTTNSEQNLLPTVRSRLQRITVKKPSKDDLMTAFNNMSEPDFNKFYAISAGLPGLMSALSSNDKHPLVEATGLARQILSSNTYERLILVDKLSKDKELVVNCLSIMQQMAEISLANSSAGTSKRWNNVLKASYQTSESLNRNGQTKLALTNLMLSL
jgi:replication-associated recombination protein RarA